MPSRDGRGAARHDDVDGGGRPGICTGFARAIGPKANG